MCVPPTLRFYGVGGFVLLAEITAAAIPLWGCCSLFCLLFSKVVLPLQLWRWKRQIAHRCFPKYSGSRCLKAHRLPEAKLILLP